MPDIAEVTFQQYSDGQEVLPGDLENDNEATRNLVGEAIASFLGAYNAVPAAAVVGVYGDGWIPLKLVASGTPDMHVHTGGASNFIFVQGRMVDSCPTLDQVIAGNASGSTRIDLISIQYTVPTTLPSNPTTREFEAIDESLSTAAVFYEQESISYRYDQGTPGSGVPPATPSGWEGFATVTVVNGASSITNGNIAQLFPTYATLLSSLIGAGVSSLAGLSGALTLNSVAQPGISVTPSGTNIAIANTGVLTVKGGAGSPAAGNIILTSTGGTGITITQVGATVTFANAGVLSVKSLIGSVDVQAASGSDITVATSGNTIVIGRNQVGSAAAAHGTTPDNTTAYALSIVLPAGGVWELFVHWDMDKNGNTTTSITHTTGTVIDWNNVAHTTGTSATPIQATVMGSGSANGGQTIGFSLNCSTNSSGLGVWHVQAIRTS